MERCRMCHISIKIMFMARGYVKLQISTFSENIFETARQNTKFSCEHCFCSKTVMIIFSQYFKDEFYRKRSRWLNS